MPDSRPSIAEFSSLVEKLASLLPPEDAWPSEAPQPEQGPGSLGGHPLDELLRETWPYARAWSGRRLSRAQLDAWHSQARRDKESLSAEIARRCRELTQAAESLKRAQAQAAAREAAAGQSWSATLAAVPRLQAACLEVRERLRARQAEALKLGTWLKQVEPHGINRYRHPQGRVFERPFLAQTMNHLQDLWARVRADQGRLEVLSQALKRARARREGASQGLDQAQEQSRLFHAIQQRKSLAFQRERLEIARLEDRLARRGRDLNRLTALKLLHGRALARAGGLLGAALAPGPASPDPLASVESHRLAAQAQASRAARLEALIARLAKRLERRSEAASQGLKQVRDLNREIARPEEELPRIVGPLTSPEGAQPLVRAAAAAQLSTLSPRLNELLPQALALRSGLELLRRRLGIEIERGRVWVESWREAAKAERAGLALARPSWRRPGSSPRAAASGPRIWRATWPLWPKPWGRFFSPT